MSQRLRISQLLVVTITLCAGCGRVSQDPGELAPDYVAAAEKLCPVMWAWVKDIGASFNEASGDVASIDSADARRARWRKSLAEMEDLNDALSEDMTRLTGDPILTPIVEEILRDIPLSNIELDDLQQLLRDTPEVDELRHQERTQQLIVRVEKVISLPKPSMAQLDTTGELIPAFRTVPSCQHALNDIDDGTPQANG